MNKQAIDFNESMLRQLSTLQQESLLKTKGLKRCPEGKLGIIANINIYTQCDFVFESRSVKT